MCSVDCKDRWGSRTVLLLEQVMSLRMVQVNQIELSRMKFLRGNDK